MGLDNQLEGVVYHPLIGEMNGLGYQDEFPMVNALVFIVTHWITIKRILKYLRKTRDYVLVLQSVEIV